MVRLIHEAHQVTDLTDEETEKYSLCGRCCGPEKKIIEIAKTNTTLPIDEPCTDPDLRELMICFGCDECEGHIGDVRMYPHPEGIPVTGRHGLWWLFFKCYNCKHQTSFQKSVEVLMKSLKNKHRGEKINSLEDLKARIILIFREKSRPLRSRELVPLLLPYEGNFHIPPYRGLGKILSLIPELVNDNGLWTLKEGGNPD